MQDAGRRRPGGGQPHRARPLDVPLDRSVQRRALGATSALDRAAGRRLDREVLANERAKSIGRENFIYVELLLDTRAGRGGSPDSVRSCTKPRPRFAKSFDRGPSFLRQKVASTTELMIGRLDAVAR